MDGLVDERSSKQLVARAAGRLGHVGPPRKVRKSMTLPLAGLPHQFPDSVRGRWAHETPYELPRSLSNHRRSRGTKRRPQAVQELIRQLKANASEAVSSMICCERLATALVAAVRKALEALEFN